MIEEKKDSFEQEILNLDKKVIYILIAGAAAIILMPILVTQLDWFFDFSKPGTGAIGDTIGGITSPVIGVVSALLIYFSFRAQINANRIIQKQITDQKKEEDEKKEFNYQMEIYKHIKEVIDKFECSDISTDPFEILKGSKALWFALRKLDDPDMFYLGSIYHTLLHAILNQFDSILDSFQNPKNHGYDIRLPLQLVNFLFQDQIWSVVGPNTLSAIEDQNTIPQNELRIYKRILCVRDRLSSVSQTEELKHQRNDI